MDPVALKTLITYISNHFFCSLDEKDFFKLGLFLSLLSKEMLEMEAIRGLCHWEKGEERHGEKHERKEKRKEECHEKENKEKDGGKEK